jgi:hypothetical protein
MKLITTLTLILFSLAFGEKAIAGCDGFPVKEKDEEAHIRCPHLKERRDCERILGCTWTPEAAKVNVCNKTDKTIAVGYRTVYQNSVSDEGWRIIETGRCQAIEAPNARSFSYFAKSNGGYSFWYGNGESMCFDDSGKKYEFTRPIGDGSCGALTGINAYQTYPVKPDDFIVSNVEGPGVDLSPAPEVFTPTYTAMALAYCPGSPGYSLTNGDTLEQAQANVLKSCQVGCSSCQLGTWVEAGRPGCIAVFKGPDPFLAWGTSYEGKESAINFGLDYCQQQGQVCKLDYIYCNDEVVKPR